MAYLGNSNASHNHKHKRRAVIFDMDGTLCDVSSIRHLVRSNQRDFHEFHMRSIDCPPHADVREAAVQARDAGLHVLVVTARKERYKSVTSWWLAINEVPSDVLRMRADYDDRPDNEVKLDILQELQEDFEIVHAWDDNPTVIAVWQSRGIPVTVVPGW